MKYLSNPFVLIGMVLLAFGLWAGTQQPRVKPVKVLCQTTKGSLEIVVMLEWSPRGAERFLQMVNAGFYNRLPLFRCINGFICQFGAPMQKPGAISYPTFPDDIAQANLHNFKQGYVSFAGYGPNSRTTHLFITLADGIKSLGTQPWETPIGFVTADSMQSTAIHFNTSYGETAPTGGGPETQKISGPGGEDYLRNGFPQLDWFQSCAVK